MSETLGGPDFALFSCGNDGGTKRVGKGSNVTGALSALQIPDWP
ncbi:hypothetical protein ACFOPN_03240 [Xanthomonas hyacinthi]|nr:hypothetical protein [Xanthomonas hyacinthi]